MAVFNSGTHLFNVPLNAVLISIFIHTLWGGNPIAAKFGLVVFPPFASAFIRFVLGVLVLLLWARFKGLSLRPTNAEWLTLLWISVMFTVQIGSMNIGIDNSSGIMSVVLISTNPIFAAIFAHFLIANDRLSVVGTTGLVLAFIGVCLTLLNPDDAMNTDWFSAGVWITTASAALLGFRLVISANVVKHIDPIKVAVWQMVFSLPMFAVASVMVETIQWHEMSWSVILGLLYQGVIVAGLGFPVSFWLVKHYKPSVMLSFNFVSPVAGVLLAAMLLNEAITPGVVAGVALVAVGLLLVTRKV